MNRRYSKVPKITICGSEKDIAAAEKVLDQDVHLARFFGPNGEAAIRVKLAVLMGKHKLKVTLLYEGNSIWSRERILADLQRIVRARDMTKMTDYLYKFLSLRCGSIAHYNKAGWVAEYPTVGDLRRFFERNEFGQHVYYYVPKCMPDVRDIVSAIEALLGGVTY